MSPTTNPPSVPPAVRAALDQVEIDIAAMLDAAGDLSALLAAQDALQTSMGLLVSTIHHAMKRAAAEKRGPLPASRVGLPPLDPADGPPVA